MHLTIRRYRMVEGASVDDLAKQVNNVFIPVLSQAPGFRAYYVVDLGHGEVASVSVFDDREGAEASTKKAADFVKDKVAPLVAAPPEITMGEVVAYK